MIVRKPKNLYTTVTMRDIPSGGRGTYHLQAPRKVAYQIVMRAK